MKTNCVIQMDLIDIAAASDASITTDSNMPFGDPLLLEEYVSQKNYGTLELNQFLLDGSKEILPAEVFDVAYWSSEASDDACMLPAGTGIRVDFTGPHTSAGIQLYFADEHPESLKLIWYNLSGEKLEESVFYPDQKIYFCERQVQNYGRVDILFLTTIFPKRYVKLQYIRYGMTLQWASGELISASLTEEVDVTGATLAVNTLDIEVVDPMRRFDPSIPDGFWISIQKSQKAWVSEWIDGIEHDCGVFFLDSHDWRDNIVSFRMVDWIGYMGRTFFYRGRIYEQETAGVIIDEIMASAGIESYMVSEDVRSIILSGYLGIQTHRNALQQVVFACGAVADCSRSDMIRIYIPDRQVKATIGPERKFLGTNITLEEYVSGVSVSYYRYNREEEHSEIYNGPVPAGDYRIEFSGPYDPLSLQVDRGEIKEAYTNYVVLHMEEAGECVLTGFGYNSVENTYTANVAMLAAGETENVKSYTGCTLINAKRVPIIAEHILDYLQLRQSVSLDYLNQGESVGQWVSILDRWQNASISNITSQSISLAGGNVATATCRGYSRVVTVYDYCGEFYAGESGRLL